MSPAAISGAVRYLGQVRMIRRERDFWQHSTPVGYIFLVGTVIGSGISIVNVAGEMNSRLP